MKATSNAREYRTGGVELGVVLVDRHIKEVSTMGGWLSLKLDNGATVVIAANNGASLEMDVHPPE